MVKWTVTNNAADDEANYIHPWSGEGGVFKLPFPKTGDPCEETWDETLRRFDFDQRSGWFQSMHTDIDLYYNDNGTWVLLCFINASHSLAFYSYSQREALEACHFLTSCAIARHKVGLIDE